MPSTITSDPTVNSFHILHLPSFFEEYMDFEKKPPAKYGEEFSSKNWITDGLLDEIEQCRPSEDDAIVNNDGVEDATTATTATKHDSEALAVAAKRLFPIHRVFASHVQLDQALRKFGSYWSFQSIHPGNEFGCSYGAPLHKRRLHPDESKRKRLYDKNLKVEVNCPFRIHYRYLGYPRKQQRAEMKLPRVYYNIQIIRAEYTHTCALSKAAYKAAVLRAGRSMPNLTEIPEIIALLRLKPGLKIAVFRALMQKCLPQFDVDDKKLMANCRSYISSHIRKTRGGDDQQQQQQQQQQPMIQDPPLRRNGVGIMGRTTNKIKEEDEWNLANAWKDEITKQELQELLQISERAALAAGCIIRIYSGCWYGSSSEANYDADEGGGTSSTPARSSSSSSSNMEDIVQECNKQAQDIIEDIIQNKCPNHEFLGKANIEPNNNAAAASEKAMSLYMSDDLFWICDPINGSTNFASGLSLCAVTICFVYKRTPVISVVYDPHQNEMFSTIRGNGAFLKLYKQQQEISEDAFVICEEPLLVAKSIRKLKDAIISTDCPADPNAFDTGMRGILLLNGQVRSIRMLACSALAAAWIAAGRLTAYFGYDLSSWDIVAGALLIQEAGGSVTDLYGRPCQLTTRNMLCSNGAGFVHNEILENLHMADSIEFTRAE